MNQAIKILNVCAVIFCFFSTEVAYSQILLVNVVQNLSFGTFYQGANGGTITISNSGVRTVTGTVTGLNVGAPYGQCMIDVTTTLFTSVSILNGPNSTLTGSNGGTMSMHIGNSNPASPFIGSVGLLRTTRVNIGGTLTVGNPAVCPGGVYNGTFYITFNNQ